MEMLNLIDSNGNQDHIKDLKSKKSALTDLLGTKAQGALVRSRFQSVALMDAGWRRRMDKAESSTHCDLMKEKNSVTAKRS